MPFINKKSLISFVVYSLLALKPIQGGNLNPFDPDPEEEATPPVDDSKDVVGPKVYTCPADNGAKYTSAGVTFELKCGHGTNAKRLDNLPGITSLSNCADLCAQEPRCQSCDWNESSKNCARFLEYIPTVPNPAINTWFPVTRRADPNEDPTFHSCPQDDGKTFSTEDGTFYRIMCQVHTIAANTPADKIKTVTSETFKDCIEACSAEPGCLSVDYTARTGDHVLKSCDLYKTGGGDKPDTTCATKSVDMAYAIDPPEEDHPDEGSIMCSTECPFANGQVFDSNFGERFHIDCGRRHGTKVIFQDEQASFKDCMNACGALLACHSVDYQISKKKCYYGQHHGEPTNVSPGWSSAHSLGCSGACSSKGCGGGAVAAAPPAPPKVEAQCPEANGKIFEQNGKKYKLWCDLINHGANDLTITPEVDFETCITKCSATDKCVRAIYHPAPKGSNKCYLRTHGNWETPVTANEGYLSAHLCANC